MPLFSGLSAHSDNKHILSAKKDIPGGVAGLDNTTKIVLAQIPDILTGKDADTLDGKHYAQVTTDIGAHATLTKTHGVSQTILGSEEKNAVNGIAALDANAKIAYAQLPNLTPRFSANGYIGNGTNGRAIAHGLGVIPKLVMIVSLGTNDGAMLINREGNIWVEAANHLGYTTTMWDSTAFYVDGVPAGGNATDKVYNWVAFG